MRNEAAFAELKKENQVLREKILQLEAVTLQQQALMNRFIQEALLQRDKRFGRSADAVPSGQLSLGIEGEAEESETRQEVPQESVNIERHVRNKPGRKPLPKNLERIRKIIDIPEADKQCGCGSMKQVIGEERSEKLMMLPALVFVLEQLRLIYGCGNCEGSGDEENPAVVSAPLPPAIIPKGIATPSLLATIFTNKFVDHLPYYRQQQRFSRMGITVSRQDMSSWQLKSSEALRPLFQLLRDLLPRGPVMHLDESKLQVLNELDRKNTCNSYMWLARGGPPDRTVYIYQYAQTRSASVAESLLQGFSGHLMSDAYKVYENVGSKLSTVTNAFCWAHCRRNYVDATKIQKQTGTAHEGIGRIKKLYEAERMLREQLHAELISLEEFVQLRAVRVLPVLRDFKRWLDKKVVQVVPSSLTGKAIAYSLNHWINLGNYLESPYLTPDNNILEREAVKPYAVSRKNWLFSGSPAGAESTALFFSLIATAKEHGLNPHVYLYYIMEKAPYATSLEDWNALLPWNVTIPKKLDRSFIEEMMDIQLPT